ncbi:hypothetical protein BH11BAC1_BH11BAC1_29660 [soil metagenome]
MNLGKPKELQGKMPGSFVKYNFIITSFQELQQAQLFLFSFPFLAAGLAASFLLRLLFSFWLLFSFPTLHAQELGIGFKN